MKIRQTVGENWNTEGCWWDRNCHKWCGTSIIVSRSICNWVWTEIGTVISNFSDILIKKIIGIFENLGHLTLDSIRSLKIVWKTSEMDVSEWVDIFCKKNHKKILKSRKVTDFSSEWVFFCQKKPIRRWIEGLPLRKNQNP